MKILLITQALDRDDAVLGFFPNWVDELAKHSLRIEAVCLYRGSYEPPPNVRVHSLGKEHGAPRFARRAVYAWRFLRLAVSLRGGYDAALVHMNQEYVLLAGWLWRLLGKRVYLWRNHYAGSLATALAVGFCDKVFYTSRRSYTARFARAVRMPVGVRTDALPPQEGEPRPAGSVLSLGRIAPSKNLRLIVDALGALARRGVPFSADFYGKTLPEDEPHRRGLIARAQDLGIAERARFYPGVPNRDTPALYRAHEVFVNASPSGMLDKAIFTAMASGCLVLVSSRDMAEMIDERCIFPEGDAAALAQKLEALLALPEEEKRRMSAELRETAAAHGLPALMDRLAREMSGTSVLFLINSLLVGGAERVFTTDANALYGRGADVEVAMLFDEGPGRRELVLPPERVHALCARGIGDLRAFVRLVRLLRRRRIAVLYTTLNEANAWGRLAAFGAPRARLYTREASMADGKPFFYRLLDVLLGWRSRRIVAVSRAVGESVRSYAPHLARRIAVLYNGAVIPSAPPERGPCGPEIKLLCVASLTPKKDQEILLRALALLPPRYTLTLVGEGALRGALEALARELGISGRVHLTGLLPAKERHEEYRNHCLFVLPSKVEGCPNVVSTAQTFALPVVAFDIPGMREFVSEKSGVLVAERSPQALAGAIANVTSSHELLRAMGLAGFGEVVRDRSLAAHLQELARILELPARAESAP